MRTVGYFIFTVPPEVRDKLRTREALSELRRAIVDVLKRHGFDRGLSRWHFKGDRSPGYAPHLNCLSDGGHLPGRVLDQIKAEYRAVLGVPVVDVHYEFARTPGRIFHMLRYVTRATFRSLDSPEEEELAGELGGFLNCHSWGGKRWNRRAVWELHDVEDRGGLSEALVSLASGRCPHCGAEVEWSGKAWSIPWLAVWVSNGKAIQIGDGFYELVDDT